MGSISKKETKLPPWTHKSSTYAMNGFSPLLILLGLDYPLFQIEWWPARSATQRPLVSPSLSRIVRSSMWLRPETVYEEQRHEARRRCATQVAWFLPWFIILDLMKCKMMSFTKLLFSLTASDCGRVNGMKIILARQLELERKGQCCLHWGRKL